MSCTTILVGKKASNDNSTMIARTDDARFQATKCIVVEPKDQPKKYKSVISHVEIDLPKDPIRYTACPRIDLVIGLWAEHGINAANVAMSATETITSNPRVLSADPMVEYQAAKGRKKAVPGGIGEEDFITIVLPYVKSAREGVLRLAELLEKYGTYESNGIAFSDEDEVWWMETIGGHHWMARRIPEDSVVINPNQFGMDWFDMEDAFGKQEANLCSKDLREFIEKNHLDLNQDGESNPRDIFGSRRDMDHIYNTPRAWFMGRYLAPYSFSWDGPYAEFGPESDDIPWSLVPDRKVTAEDVQYLLGSHYQGTPYDPYSGKDTGVRGKYRTIGINRTIVTCICQIRSGVPDESKGVQWVCFGSPTFSAFLPVYSNVPKMPKYLSGTTLEVSTEAFYWGSRILDALADHNYPTCIQMIERYQTAVSTKGRTIIREYDAKLAAGAPVSVLAEANEKLAAMAKKQTANTLDQVLLDASMHMKNGYNRADN